MAKSKGLRAKANYEAIRDHIFDRIHKTGEEVKNDFPNLLRGAIQTKAWKHFRDNDGKPFKNLVDWLTYSFPNGTSMGLGKNAITYDDAMKLTEGHPEVHKVLARNAPKAKAGRKKNSNVDVAIFPRKQSSSKNVLSARLSQEFPEYYDAYLRGQYKTITEAATAAGLIKDDANLRRAKSAFRKMSPQERKEFQKWLRTDEAKEVKSKKKK